MSVCDEKGRGWEGAAEREREREGEKGMRNDRREGRRGG